MGTGESCPRLPVHLWQPLALQDHCGAAVRARILVVAHDAVYRALANFGRAFGALFVQVFSDRTLFDEAFCVLRAYSRSRAYRLAVRRVVRSEVEENLEVEPSDILHSFWAEPDKEAFVDYVCQLLLEAALSRRCDHGSCS